jgi:hypothetical protein
VQHCKDGAVDHKFVKPVEEHIRRYLASLSEASKRQIWSQTETGQVTGGDARYFDIGTIEMDLESELLAEMPEHAFRNGSDSCSTSMRQ